MKVLKKLDRPVLFLGLPVNLAFAYTMCFCIGVIGILIFVMNDKFILSALPLLAMFYGMYRIKTFYKKYGHKGFTPAQRDKTLANSYKVDKMFNKMIEK